MKWMWWILLVFLSTGCAHYPPSDNGGMKYGKCVIPTERTNGSGARVLDCAYLLFGPNKEQQAKFGKLI